MRPVTLSMSTGFPFCVMRCDHLSWRSPVNKTRNAYSFGNGGRGRAGGTSAANFNGNFISNAHMSFLISCTSLIISSTISCASTSRVGVCCNETGGDGLVGHSSNADIKSPSSSSPRFLRFFTGEPHSMQRAVVVVGGVAVRSAVKKKSSASCDDRLK